jgi:hypothetical protein
MGTKRGDSRRRRPREETRLKTDLPFEEAVKRLLSTPPPGKEPPQPSDQPRRAGDSPPE